MKLGGSLDHNNLRWPHRAVERCAQTWQTLPVIDFTAFKTDLILLYQMKPESFSSTRWLFSQISLTNGSWNRVAFTGFPSSPPVLCSRAECCPWWTACPRRLETASPKHPWSSFPAGPGGGKEKRGGRNDIGAQEVGSVIFQSILVCLLWLPTLSSPALRDPSVHKACMRGLFCVAKHPNNCNDSLKEPQTVSSAGHCLGWEVSRELVLLEGRTEEVYLWLEYLL